MPEKWNFCDNVYSNKSNSASRERVVHADEKDIPVYRCSICPVTCCQLSESQSNLSAITDLQTFDIIVILRQKLVLRTHQKTTRVTCS